MHPEVTEETLKSVNCVMSGSAPLGALDEQRFLEKAKKDMDILQGKTKLFSRLRQHKSP